MNQKNLLIVAALFSLTLLITFSIFFLVPPENEKQTAGDSKIVSICGDSKGSYETLSTVIGEINLFTCGTEYKITNKNFKIITEQNWETVIGRITSAKQAYFAFIIMKHPDQLKTILQNPSLVDVGNSSNLPNNLYRTDLTIAEKEKGCQIYKKLQFADLPAYDEFENYYNIERVYRDNLNYYHELAKLNYNGKIVSYELNPMISCQ